MSLNIDHTNNTIKLDTGHPADAIFKDGIIGTTLNANYPAGIAGGATTFALVANQIMAVPFVVGRKCTTDIISCKVTTGATGTVLYMGIYGPTSATNAYPGTILTTAVSASMAAATKNLTYVSTLQPGVIYWLAFVSDGASGDAIAGQGAAAGAGLLGMDVTLTNIQTYLYYAYGSVALPTTFPASATIGSGTFPLLTYRLSA